MKHFWIAELETRHYSFSGYGRTAEEAKQAILTEWLSHDWNKYFCTEITTTEQLEESKDMWCYKVTLGKCEVR